jgi:hypothetical protein
VQDSPGNATSHLDDRRAVGGEPTESLSKMIIVQPSESSPRVTVIQILLNRAGYELKVDGRFGQKARVAVLDFQHKKLITPANAQVEPSTWKQQWLRSSLCLSAFGGMHPFELRSQGGTSSIENLANARGQNSRRRPI